MQKVNQQSCSCNNLLARPVTRLDHSTQAEKKVLWKWYKLITGFMWVGEIEKQSRVLWRLVECDTRREHEHSNKSSTTESIEKICTSCLLLSACEGGEEEEEVASDDFCRKSGNSETRWDAGEACRNLKKKNTIPSNRAQEALTQSKLIMHSERRRTFR